MASAGFRDSLPARKQLTYSAASAADDGSVSCASTEMYEPSVPSQSPSPRRAVQRISHSGSGGSSGSGGNGSSSVSGGTRRRCHDDPDAASCSSRPALDAVAIPVMDKHEAQVSVASLKAQYDEQIRVRQSACVFTSELFMLRRLNEPSCLW